MASCKFVHNGQEYNQDQFENIIAEVVQDNNDVVGDEIFYQMGHSAILKVGRRFNMNDQGWMPPNINEWEVKRDLKRAGITNVTLKRASGGSRSYFFVVKNRGVFKPNEVWQMRASDVPVDERLDALIMNFLNKIGATVEFGELEGDAAAKVRLLDKVITIAQTRQGIDTLTEEAAHIMVSMLRGTDAYNKMMSVITTMRIFEEVQSEYADAGYTYKQMKEEAVVKMITSLAVEKAVNDREQKTFRAWIEFILEALRDLWAGRPLLEFRRSAKKLLDGDISNLSSDHIQAGEEMQQKIKVGSDKKTQKALYDKAMEMRKMEMTTNEKGRYYIPSLDKEVRFRATDKVNEHAKWLFSGQSEFSPELKKLYTTKGTIAHMYKQLIMEYLKEETPFTKRELEKIVYEELKDHPEFKEVANNKSYFELRPIQYSNLKKGVANLYNTIKERDEEAIILTEQKIYDPRGTGKNDIGGTIDVLILYSDGTVGLYDYKTTKLKKDPDMEGDEKYLAPGDVKRQFYDVQISLYKAILSETWGVSYSQFRESRIILANVDYTDEKDWTKKEYSMYEVNNADFTKEYLSQISAGEEFIPEDESLNTFLRKMYETRADLRNQWKNSSGDKKKKIGITLTGINDTINDILVHGDVAMAIKTVTPMIDDIAMNVGKFSPSKIMEYLNLLKVYRGFNVAFNKTLVEMKKDQKKKEKAEVLHEQIKHYTDLLGNSINTLEQALIDYSNGIADRDISKGIKQMNFMGNYYKGAAYWNSPLLEAMMTLVATKNEMVRREMMKARENIFEKHSAYLKWARANGHSGGKLFDPLIEDKDNNLIRQLKKEFWTTRDEMAKEGKKLASLGQDYSEQLEWFKEHYTFDSKRWLDDYEDLQDIMDQNKSYSQKAKDQELFKFEQINPEKNEKAWFFFDRHGKYFKAKDAMDPSQFNYVSDRWRFLNKKENKPALDYYNMFTGYMEEFGGKIGWDLIKSKTWVPELRSNLVERIGNLGAFKQVSVLEDFKDSLEVMEHDQVYGVTDSGDVRRIPLLGSSSLRGTVTDNEKAAIQREVSLEFQRGTPEYEDEVERRVNRLSYEKGSKKKSRELTKSLILFVDSAYDYLYSKEIEDDILAMREIVMMDDKYDETPTDRYSRPMFDFINNKYVKKLGASLTTKSAVEDFVDLHLYKKRLKGKDNIYYSGNRAYSSSKTIQLGHAYLSLKSLAFNPRMGFANWVNAAINKRIVGNRKMYYTNETLKEAFDSYTGADDKALAAIYFFEPKSRDLNYEEALKGSSTKALKWFNSRTWFALHRGVINKKGSKEWGVDNPIFGDDNIDNAILVAMMKYWVIGKDGKIYSPGNYNNPPPKDNVGTIWDNFTYDKKNKTFEVKGLLTSEFIRFRRAMFEAQYYIKGTKSPDQMNRANMYIYSQMLNKFRDWIPGLIIQKWSGFRYNSIVEGFEEGHFWTAFNEITGVTKSKKMEMGVIEAEQEIMAAGIATVLKSLARALGRMAKILAESLTFGYWNTLPIDKEIAEYYYLKYLSENPEMNKDVFTFEKFLEFRKNQISTMAQELSYHLYVGLGILTLMVGMGWDDDDSSIWAKNAYAFTRRASLELSFWFSPSSVEEILKSPVPLMRVMTDAGRMLGNGLQETAEFVGFVDENNRDRTPFLYYTTKNIIGLNQALSLAGYYNQSYQRGTLQDLLTEGVWIEMIGLEK